MARRISNTKRPARAAHARRAPDTPEQAVGTRTKQRSQTPRTSYQAQRRKRRSRALLVQSCLSMVIVVLLFGISYVSVKLLHGEPAWPLEAVLPTASAPGEPAQTDASDSGTASGADGEGERISVSDGAAAPVEEQDWNTAAPLSDASPEAFAGEARLIAVPANGRLSAEYFRTTLFIGDSLSQGFALYQPTREVAAVCAYKSTSPNQVLQNFVGSRPDGTRIEMWDDINIQTPGNIYLLFGTNALLQQSDEAFLKYYGDLMDKLRERFAGVPIYVQSITPTTAEQGVKQPPLENGHIRAINNEVARLAREKGLYYLDAQEALADSAGNLRADYVGTYDGIHMNPTGYAAWADYILTHTVYSDANAAFVTEGPYT